MIAPMKVGKETDQGLRFIKRQKADVAGTTEMDPGGHSLMPMMRMIFGLLYHIFTKDVGPHSEEIPLAKRRTFGRKTKFFLHQISPNLEGPGTGNDRYLAELWVRRRGRTLVFFLVHTNAVVQNHDPHSPNYGDFFDNERWEVSKDAWDFIANRISLAQAEADGIVFMGDVNVLPVGEGLTDAHSPYVILGKLGFRVDNERVTILASWRLRRAGALEVIPVGHPGWPSDHAAMARTYAMPTRRRKR